MPGRPPLGAVPLASDRALRLAQPKSCSVAHKLYDSLDIGIRLKIFFQLLDALFQRSLFSEQLGERFVHGLDLLFGEATPFQSNKVEAGKVSPIALNAAKGNDIAIDTRGAADHREGADADELMNRCKPADNDAIADPDMSTKGCVVGQDHMTADHAVVGDVAPDHEQAVIADDGPQPACRGAWVHRHILTDGVVLADDQLRRFAGVFQILRRRTNGSERINYGSCANPRAAINNDVGFQDDRITQHNGRPDDGVGADPNAAADLGPRINHSGRMNIAHGNAVRRLNAHINSNAITEIEGHRCVSIAQAHHPLGTSTDRCTSMPAPRARRVADGVGAPEIAYFKSSTPNDRARFTHRPLAAA